MIGRSHPPTRWSGAVSTEVTCIGREVHYSGILVHAEPGTVDRCREEVELLPGVDVHFVYPESGRLIVVQETADARAQEEGFRGIQALGSVRAAALVEHRVDQEPGDTDGGSP